MGSGEGSGEAHGSVIGVFASDNGRDSNRKDPGTT